MKKLIDHLELRGTGMSFFCAKLKEDIAIKKLKSIPYPKDGSRIFRTSNFPLKNK